MSKNFSNSNNEKINNQKSRNRLVKSSSTGVNDLRKYNSSASKVNNNKKNTSNSSFN